GRLDAAAARWGGEPLVEDRYEDWAASARARLIDLYAQVLAALADEHATSGDHATVVAVARRQLDLDPLDEGAHRRLMLAYARSGRRGHALRQFLACRQALVDGLGIEPDAETAALQRRILAGDPV
ncbi:MAG TPA: bacterial transcriptional activator domain-containing protein, partial [Thermoleophilaceae bacterium]|nr:bacterial transcriptional activator domain-containing protein [Thermoleophilaceae bacterium]